MKHFAIAVPPHTSGFPEKTIANRESQMVANSTPTGQDGTFRTPRLGNRLPALEKTLSQEVPGPSSVPFDLARSGSWP
jgi:hypothetical protein